MKNLIFTLLCCFVVFQAYSQAQLTPADWQADLRFLQQTVHKDYPFLFRKVTAEQFDAEVDKLHNAIPGLQDHEIMLGLARIVASFQYGHTDISLNEGPVKFHNIPVNLYWFSDGIFVEGAHKDYAPALGARLLKVEGMPVEDALQRLRPLLPVENEQYFKAYILDFLCIPEALHAQGVTRSLQQTITFTLEKDGKTFEQTFKAAEYARLPRKYGFVQPNENWLSSRDQNQTPYYLKTLDRIYYYEYLPESKTLYVRHSQIQDDPAEAIPAFYQRVFDFIEQNEVERLVLDVRLNGGGNNYKNKPIVTGVIRSRINRPGKFFVIIGRRTFSACQNLVNELDNYTEAIFIGEPTSENINFYGDNNRVELPHSKAPVFLSFAWWQDKPQWENGDWLAPHLAVDMDFDQYRSNQDPVLDAALAFDDPNFVRNPMSYLESLFFQNKIDQLKAEATRMVRDPHYRFVNFEEQLNERGYRLLNRNQLEQAIFVFQFNTELFPGSANAWDSLAEAFRKAGQKEKAIEYYQKAAALDPDGDVGANARKILKEMETQK